MKDYAVRSISKDGFVKGFAALTTQTVQELQKRHRLFPVASAALGRTATMGAMMGLSLKEPHHRITIRVVGDGPLGQICVNVDGQGGVRGFVDHPELMLPLNSLGKLDVAKAVGAGTVYVVTDYGLKKPFQGQVPIISGELAEDFTYYFAKSEQIPSSVGLGVLVNRDQILVAGGYMIQVMPGASEKQIQKIEERVSHLDSITNQLQHITPEQLLARLIGEDMKVLATEPIQFACTCSKEQTDRMLQSLGEKELGLIIEEDGEANIDCDFCQESYYYNQNELIGLLQELKNHS